MKIQVFNTIRKWPIKNVGKKSHKSLAALKKLTENVLSLLKSNDINI